MRLGSESHSSITAGGINKQTIVDIIQYVSGAACLPFRTVISWIVVDGTCRVDKAHIVYQGIR